VNIIIVLIMSITMLMATEELQQNISETNQTKIDKINQEIEQNYVGIKTINLLGEISEEIKEIQYTNEEWEKDISILKELFKTKEPKVQEYIEELYKKYKERTETEKEKMLQIQPIVLELVAKKFNQMKIEYIVKEEENVLGVYKIEIGKEYYIHWENKNIYESETEELTKEEKEYLFKISYDNFYDYLAIKWPKSKPESKKTEKDYPIIIRLDNSYGIYFKDLEKKVNAQIKLVETQGYDFVNPFEGLN